MQPGNHEQETQKLDVISPNPLAAPDPNDPLADLDPEEREAYEQLKRMRAERRRKKLIRGGRRRWHHRRNRRRLLRLPRRHGKQAG